jgi:Uma2 family endonuclease
MSAQVLTPATPKRGTLAYLDVFPSEVLTMSIEEYWANELKNEYKSEFYKNKVTAIMPYTTQPHNDIISNLIVTLKPWTREQSWILAHENRPVWVAACELNTYPDVYIAEKSESIVRKGYPLSETSPAVIIEVLSPSTEGYDKGKKLRCYRQIPSLKQIILIAQNEPTIDVYQKNDKGEWIYFDVTGIENNITIAEKNISLSEIYHDIDFQAVVEA